VNLANRLTLSRILLTFVLMGLLYIENFWAKLGALLIFVAACATDYLDGWIARTRGQATDFGKIIDPIADKVLVLGVFLSFVELKLIPSWMVVVIMIREFTITGMRLFAIRRGIVLAAEKAGKHKTVSQMVAILFILIFLCVRELWIGGAGWGVSHQEAFQWGIWILMMGALVLTLISGVSFVWNNRRLIRNL
jgi:CDP-diacylglycerol---glycerol-3-phosphate 3-phosphatidyltransferase